MKERLNKLNGINTWFGNGKKVGIGVLFIAAMSISVFVLGTNKYLEVGFILGCLGTLSLMNALFSKCNKVNIPFFPYVCGNLALVLGMMAFNSLGHTLMYVGITVLSVAMVGYNIFLLKKESTIGRIITGILFAVATMFMFLIIIVIMALLTME